jgi:hypothetical protein
LTPSRISIVSRSPGGSTLMAWKRRSSERSLLDVDAARRRRADAADLAAAQRRLRMFAASGRPHKPAPSVYSS